MACKNKNCWHCLNCADKNKEKLMKKFNTCEYCTNLIRHLAVCIMKESYEFCDNPACRGFIADIIKIEDDANEES